MIMRPSQLLILSLVLVRTNGFSGSNNNVVDSDTFALFDRFSAACPADWDAIARFDPSLVIVDDEGNRNDHPKTSWVAVFRSANNKPSVFIKDDFLNAMRIATSLETDVTTTSSSSASALPEGLESVSDSPSSILETSPPVAVARLTPSSDSDDCWVLDTMRCTLKKENTDASCDGGSEHAEALGVAIDALLIQYLMSQSERFDGVIRTKATLVSGVLLEDRGFRPVTSLSKDMATHTCSLDACLNQYADRAISTTAKGPGARQRALQICSLLGRIDREPDLEASEQLQGRVEKQEKEDDEGSDPWAAMKKFI